MSQEASVHQGEGSFIRCCGYFAIAAGFLEIVAGLRLTDDHLEMTETLYVLADLCLLLGILGWHLHEHNDVGITGLVGFLLAFLGTGFIAGPSAELFGVSAYSIGVPVIAVGLLTMSLCSFMRGTLPGWIILVFLVSFALMMATPFIPSLYNPISFFNIVYGLAFLGLGYRLIGQGRR